MPSAWKQEKRTANPHQVTGGGFFLIQMVPTVLESSVGLSGMDVFSWVTQSTQIFTPSQSSDSLLKGLSMQILKYATHSKCSFSAVAQLAKTQGDFSSNIISDRCVFSQHISVHIKTSHSFDKGVNYFLCFNYFHDHSQLFTFHCVRGKWTLPKHFLRLQEPLHGLITTDPLRDLDILLLL